MRKSWVLVILFFLSLFAIVSCGKNHSTGIAGAGKIKLTETQTPTPDVNFTVYIHQEATPVKDVSLTLRSMVTNATLTAKTGPAGLGGFEVHSGGQWNLQVDGFNGFKTQAFTVEPLSNTFYAVNFGIPSLDLELVSGSETIGIAPNTLVYKVTYHTRFERPEKITINKENICTVIYSLPDMVSNEGDYINCTIEIPKSYEGYDNSNKYLYYKAICKNSDGSINTESNERFLIKGWSFQVSTDFHYIQVYDYADNYGHISYYGALKNTTYILDSPGYTSAGISYEIVGVTNTGSDGSAAFINPGPCLPAFFNYGCYNVLAKIPTNAGLSNNFKNDNNGTMAVRFHDAVYLDITRSFITANNWNPMICAHWCCTSRDISRSSYVCGYITMPFSSCFAKWDHFATADMIREKMETISITK